MKGMLEYIWAAAGCEDPGAGDKVAVAADLPHKKEPGPKPLRCWPPSFQAYKALFPLPFPVMPLGRQGK